MNTSGKTALHDVTQSQDLKDRWAHPMAVVRDPSMTIDEKRAILASWASDQRSVPNNPSLRQLGKSRLVEIDDILEALMRLDQLTTHSTANDPGKRWRDHLPTFNHLGRSKRDDDDDPPTPAPAVVRPRPPVLEGGVTAVAVAA